MRNIAVDVIEYTENQIYKNYKDDMFILYHMVITS